VLTVLDFSLIQPEIILLLTAVIVLLIDAFFKEAGGRFMYMFASAGLLASIVSLVPAIHAPIVMGWGGQVIQDQVSVLLKMAICAVAFLVYVYSFYFNRAHQIPQGAYFILSLLAIVGALVLCSAEHMLLMYLGLELVTLPMLALIALPRDGISSEAAMKYFVLSALASGFLLYGISLWYGITGVLHFNQLSQMVATMPLSAGLLFATVFISIGVCFKLGVVPFQMWVPDAYQGAPTSVTGLLGTVSKLAAFALLFRIFINALPSLTPTWQIMLFAVAILSVVLGNAVAVVQNNTKRLLAYSTIAHMGFLLLGFAEGTALGLGSALFYALTYALSAAAAFGVLMMLKQANKPVDQMKDLRGLSHNHLGFAIMLAVVLFSMAGVPPFVGFDAKLFILKALIAKGHIAIAIIAVLMSVVGAYYYLRLIKIMFFREASEEKPAPETIAYGGAKMVLIINTALLVALGIFPSPLLEWAQSAVL
jgi:NADH-quinone oxidoreductase subunit N